MPPRAFIPRVKGQQPSVAGRVTSMCIRVSEVVRPQSPPLHRARAMLATLAQQAESSDPPGWALLTLDDCCPGYEVAEPATRAAKERVVAELHCALDQSGDPEEQDRIRSAIWWLTVPVSPWESTGRKAGPAVGAR